LVIAGILTAFPAASLQTPQLYKQANCRRKTNRRAIFVHCNIQRAAPISGAIGIGQAFSSWSRFSSSNSIRLLNTKPINAAAAIISQGGGVDRLGVE